MDEEDIKAGVLALVEGGVFKLNGSPEDIEVDYDEKSGIGRVRGPLAVNWAFVMSEMISIYRKLKEELSEYKRDVQKAMLCSALALMLTKPCTTEESWVRGAVLRMAVGGTIARWLEEKKAPCGVKGYKHLIVPPETPSDDAVMEWDWKEKGVKPKIKPKPKMKSLREIFGEK